jgi:hypothetical protein
VGGREWSFRIKQAAQMKHCSRKKGDCSITSASRGHALGTGEQASSELIPQTVMSELAEWEDKKLTCLGFDKKDTVRQTHIQGQQKVRNST